MIAIKEKDYISRSKRILTNILAVVLSILFSMLIIALLRINPFTLYLKVIEGSLGSVYRFHETLNKAIPLTILSLGIGIAFKMKFWNIGAEGQFYMGAFGAALTFRLFPSLPLPLMITAMMLSSIIFGALYGEVSCVLKLKWGVSETLVTLMLNYIAMKWVGFLQYGPWRDPEGLGFPRVASFSENAIIPKLFGVHFGWVIMLVLTALFFFLLAKTKFGYEVSVIGESVETARYAAINVSRVMLLAVFLSGGLCGLAGGIQASAIETSISANMSSGMGFTAIITTWLAHLNPLLMLVVSFFFSMLLQGGTFLQSSMQIPAAVSEIVEGLIIFFVIGSEFFTRYRITFTRRN